MDAIERWRREDTDALIVVFGDHLPLLGWNPGGFVESGLLAASDEGYTPQMYRTAAATPLIVIDGREGVLRPGDVPLYRLGALVSRLAGVRQPTLLDLVPPPAGAALRPLTGVVLLLDAEGAIGLCREGERRAACDPVQRWMNDARLIGRDLFSGHQHALGVLARRAAG